jgi:hypothetical protein
MASDTKSGPRRPALGGAIALAAALCGGCSLLLHADPSQCSTDGDCVARGPLFANHVCVGGTCVLDSPTSSGDSGHETGADTGADATVDTGPVVLADVAVDRETSVETGGETAMPEAAVPDAVPDAPGCASNADCTASVTHPEVACDVSSGTCIQLTTDECPLVIGDYSGKTEPPLFFGSFATLPPNGLTSHPSYLNYKLAIDEFTVSGGIPAGPGNGLRMPVAIVCNSGADVHKATVHLQSDIHVPGIIAAFDSVTLRTEFSNDFGPASTFVINPFGANSTIVAPTLTTNGLLWHMLGQASDSAPAYAAFFPRAEAYVRSLQNLVTATSDGGTTPTPIRVATITANATDTQDLATAVENILQWNGQSLAQNTAAGLYKNVNVQSILSGNSLTAIDVSTAVTTLLNFRPNIIISFASSEFVKMLEVLELQWPSTTDAGDPNPLPFYLVSPYNMVSQELLSGFIGSGTGAATEAKRKRVAGIGVASPTDTHELVAYENRFLGEFSNGQSSLGQENYYDAMYLMVYSIVGAGRVPNLAGPDLGRGVLRLMSGASYDEGPGSAMGNIFGALSAPNGTVNLFGADGPSDFNRATGARIGQGSVYCVSRNVTTGAPSYAYDVLTLAPSSDGGPAALGGAFSCYGGL